MSEFGLVEITRKRIRDPLMKLWTQCCQSCSSTGRQRTVESIGLEIVRRAEIEGTAVPGKTVVIRGAPEIMRWLIGHEEEIRAGLVRRGVPRVRFEQRGEFERDGFDVAAA
jgi:ribonuclease G